MLAFCRDRKGGAIFAGGLLLLLAMIVPSAMMVNYAWREAQWEELRAAARAATAAAGFRLAGAGGAMDEEIKERVAAFSTGLIEDLNVEADDVDVSHDPATNTTTVTVLGTYVFHNLWEVADEDEETVVTVVDVRVEAERYEVAVALDVSTSMSRPLPDGVIKLDGLKAAVARVADVMESASATTPGGMLVSVVPFSAAVNVADTCNADPATGMCRAARSPGKERYVRMLAGARASMADTLADARDARSQGIGGHWVDTFHHYGTATGALRRQYLPTDLLDDRDWNLRRTDVAIDASAQLPRGMRWTVDDEDFWNGCVMARWGAYWDSDARPAGWTADDADNWPAKRAVPGWSPASPALADDTPLHLSDAPPLADEPSTLFTAYSWPDSRIGGSADRLLRDTMIEMLHPGIRTSSGAGGDNAWSANGKGGNVFCPPSAITPLTDDLNVVRQAADGLAITPYYWGGTVPTGATYVNLGIVWGLRTLSPLWRDVWDIRDVQNATRPGIPCAVDEDETGCDRLLRKSILIVSDGASVLGKAVGSRLIPHYRRVEDISFSTELPCRSVGDLATYHEAEAATDPSAFNAYFRAPHAIPDLVGGDGKFNVRGLGTFADAFLGIAGRDRDPGSVVGLANAAGVAASGGTPTPWQLFRGLDAGVNDALAGSSAFQLDGRPVLMGKRCRPASTFSPYGRADDLVYVGSDSLDPLSPLPPVADVAPFETASLPVAAAGDGSPGSVDANTLRSALNQRIDDWLLDACAIAGARRVRINAVFIGYRSRHEQEIALLEQCVDASGGDPDEDNVFVTPTSAELTDAFERVFTVRRNLRFLN